ncbi:hypothetical protein A2335_01465 [Candidatus Peregrinibacteria bacterium RIFOXYB2_FULL_32_7]|nr:MAG: hypothetical protein A2335_01465 [Candidatus Peregrinibacteria bacterium RIFOXYB2_FULL_32_7]
MQNIFILIIGFLIGQAIFFVFEKRKLTQSKLKLKFFNKKNEETKEEAQNIIKQSQDQAQNIKEQIEAEAKKVQERMDIIEEKIKLKEDFSSKKEKRNQEGLEFLRNHEKEILNFKEKIKQFDEELIIKLCNRNKLAKEEVVNELKNEMTKIFAIIVPNYINKIKIDFEENGQKDAKNILAWIMQRCSLGSSVDRKEMSIKVPSEKMKGMIIGKEGKNIEYFENTLDVDVLFNHDGPDIIRVSSHDLLKKALAKETLELMMREKTINPEIIDQCFSKAKEKIREIIKIMGKKAVEMLGLQEVPEKIQNLFGRFEYRSSYGQNIWVHSMEVCYFATMLADEIEADREVAKLAGFTHDLGKAVDLQITTDTGFHKEVATKLLDAQIAEQLDGNKTHDDISKIILENWQFPKDENLRKKVIYAGYCHHEKVPYRNPEDYLIKAADAISSGRPGARQETFELYLNRIKELEELGGSVGNIKKCYSVSAGRELRLIVDESMVKDEQMQGIADITAKNIQETLSYPGKIKVNVIRWTEYKEKANVK